MHRPANVVLPVAILASFFLGGLGFTAAQSMTLAAPERPNRQAGELVPAPAIPIDSSSEAVSPTANHEGSTACSPTSKYPESVTRWCSLIEESAVQHGLAVDLIAALMLEESGGDPLAYSASGAVGLLQVMPSDGLAEAFQCINGPCFASRPSTGELQDPAFNLDYGARLLKGLWNRTGDLREGLKAYGPMGVGYTYADAVLAILETYQQVGE